MRTEDLLKVKYGQPLYVVVRSNGEPRKRVQSASFVSVSLVRATFPSQSAWVQRGDQSSVTIVHANQLFLTKEEADNAVSF